MKWYEKRREKESLQEKQKKSTQEKQETPQKWKEMKHPLFYPKKKRNSVNIFFSFESKLDKRMLFLQPQKPLIPHRIVVNIFHAFAANPIGLRYEVVLIVIRVGPSSFCVRAAGIPDSN